MRDTVLKRDVRATLELDSMEDVYLFNLALGTMQNDLHAADSVSSRRLSIAAEWALDLDVQYRDVLQAGYRVQIRVPLTFKNSRVRASQQTVEDYWGLRLSVGELLHPMFGDLPDMHRLYPFQREGVQWLLKQTSAILADDMGLGKTVQVISAIRLLFNRAKIRTTLVVCPKGLIANWEQEFRRWAPELGVAVLTPNARIREEAWAALARRRHVLITNYEQLRDPPNVLRRDPPDVIIADEAHRLRNRNAQVTSGNFELRPERYWALTGTPMERDLEDLATLLSVVAPTDFGPQDAKLHPSSLRSRARPYVLRRRKEDVLSQLPVVIEINEKLDLSEAQRKEYRSAVSYYRRTNRVGDELALLTRLLSLCDLEPKSRQSCKIDRIIDRLEQIKDQQEKAVVFSYRLDPLRELEKRIAQRWGSNSLELLLGEMNANLRHRAISRFQNGKNVMALLASSRVGGEGLTLVEANHVFFFNQWWNPSANNQARDRVVRIGQKRRVHVYRFLCRDTIEDSLKRILESKQELFDNTVERFAAGGYGALDTLASRELIDQLMTETSG